jgi:hypothetical protein
VASSRIIWNGNPGEVWTNNTERFKYQLIVAYSNSCGFCIQYDRAVSNWWPLPFHPRCRCRQLLIRPGGSAEQFVDFKVKLASLPPVQITSAIGASNYRLLESGVVQWGDIVTETRVRSFREVVQRSKLSQAGLLKAGVRDDHATHALARINTPKQVFIREHRAELVKRIQSAGLSDAQIKEAISAGIGERVGLVGVKANTTVTQASSRLSRLPETLRSALAYYGRKLRDLFGSAKPLPPKVTDEPTDRPE